MAFASNCMTKADMCPNCGKTMGFVAGLRGLGLRQKGHLGRCMKRSKAVLESPAIMGAEAPTPYCPPAASGETPWHLKPSVGTWNLKPSLIGVHLEHPATDVHPGQIQPANESESLAATEASACHVAHEHKGAQPSPAASEVVDTLLVEQPHFETQVVEKELTTPTKQVPLTNAAPEQESSLAALAASEVATDALWEQPRPEKAVDGSKAEIDAITSPKETQLAPESLASTPEENESSETAAHAHEIIEKASQALEPELSTVVSEVVGDVHKEQPYSETTGDDSRVGMESSAPSKDESVESSCSFAQRSEGLSTPGTESLKSNKRKKMYRKGTANSQQLKRQVKVQN